MRLISGTLHSTPLPWLQVLSNIEPPALWRKAATDELVEKIVKRDSWPIQPDIFNPSLLRITSRKPLWLDLQPFDIKSRWRHNWKSAQVDNSHLVYGPQSGNWVSTSLSNSGLCWTVYTWNRDTACLQKEMATYRHWSVTLWWDPDDFQHCRILSPDKTEWRLISATLCGWRRCFVADQLWFMTRIREEEDCLSLHCINIRPYIYVNAFKRYVLDWLFWRHVSTRTEAMCWDFIVNIEACLLAEQQLHKRTRLQYTSYCNSAARRQKWTWFNYWLRSFTRSHIHCVMGFWSNMYRDNLRDYAHLLWKFHDNSFDLFRLTGSGCDPALFSSLSMIWQTNHCLSVLWH